MTNIGINELACKIADINNILILTHEKPDGDALGSSFAALKYFQETGRDAVLFLPETVPVKYEKYVPMEDVYFNEINGNILEGIEWVLCLDCSDLERLGKPEQYKNNFPVKKAINVDHHFDNDLYAEINLIDPKAAAAGEIFFDILCNIQTYNISGKVAEGILLAIITDTGGLRFDNTDSKIFPKVATLINCGGNYLEIIKQIFFSKSYALYMLESELAVNYLNWDFDKRFVYAYVTGDLLSKYNLTIKDIESLIDSYRIIEGVIIAALITKRGDRFKISLRSNNENYSVVDIAHKLNGGGHKMAAGCSVETDKFEVAETELKKLVEKVLKPVNYETKRQLTISFFI